MFALFNLQGTLRFPGRSRERLSILSQQVSFVKNFFLSFFTNLNSRAVQRAHRECSVIIPKQGLFVNYIFVKKVHKG